MFLIELRVPAASEVPEVRPGHSIGAKGQARPFHSYGQLWNARYRPHCNYSQGMVGGCERMIKDVKGCEWVGV